MLGYFSMKTWIEERDNYETGETDSVRCQLLPKKKKKKWHKPGSPGTPEGRAKGGRVGGKRALETMTPAERSERARKAAQARWKITK